MNPRDPIYDRGSCIGRFAAFMAVVAVIALVATAFFVWNAMSGERRDAQATLFSLAAAWAIGAPIWFALEYHLLYRKAAGKDSWEQFKHGQQVAVAVWAGISASLYGLGSSDLAKPKEDEKCFVQINFSEKSAPPIFRPTKCPN